MKLSDAQIRLLGYVRHSDETEVPRRMLPTVQVLARRSLVSYHMTDSRYVTVVPTRLGRTMFDAIQAEQSA